MRPHRDRANSEFIAALIAQQQPDVCQIWPYACDKLGYARVWIGGRSRYVHRVAWEMVKGPLGELVLDHFKMNENATACSRACVNLYHLEAVTAKDHARRGRSPGAVNMRKTHCVNGHEFTPENTCYQQRGGRVCRVCRRKVQRKRV
jgi:hypothetical protein